MNLVTPKGGAKHELMFNEPTSDGQQTRRRTSKVNLTARMKYNNLRLFTQQAYKTPSNINSLEQLEST